MPHNKRKREDFDPTKSDSSDEDFTDQPDPVKAKVAPKPTKKKGRRKRVRRGSNIDFSSGDDEEAEESSADDVVDETVKPEMNASGRFKRRSAQKPVNYQESEGDTDGSREEVDDEHDAGEEPVVTTKKSKVVKLILNTSSLNTRGSRGRRGPSSEPLSAGKRRSSRLHHEDQDPIIALTTSGKHAEIIRPPTHSPERAQRHTRGGKGIKGPAGTVASDERPRSRAGKSLPANYAEQAQPRGKTISMAHDGGEGSDGETGTQDPTAGEDEALEDDEDEDEGEEEPATKATSNVEAEDEDDDEDDGPVKRSGRRKVRIDENVSS